EKHKVSQIRIKAAHGSQVTVAKESKAMAQGREVFARFVQDLRAAWGAVQDVESRMKQFAKLLEGLVSNPALRESSKTWRRWAKRGANGGDLSRPATGGHRHEEIGKTVGLGKPSSVS